MTSEEVLGTEEQDLLQKFWPVALPDVNYDPRVSVHYQNHSAIKTETHKEHSEG